ncbi:MAG: hypothetical protein M0R80_24975 [Proteobacteria bacterium]|jgi:hypothetical protein|nr:hypothetical protein [Pseudomonadota bacterium]
MKEEFINEIIATFESRYGHKLTREDGREIAENLTGLAQLLLKWHREDQEKANSQLIEPTSASDETPRDP